MIIKKFEDIVKKYPQKIAIKGEDKTLTYEELKGYADGIAASITTKLSRTATDHKVTLYLDHGVDMIAAILGTLKSGHIYVPLSTDYPEHRLSYMITNSEASLIITETKHMETASKLANQKGIELLDINDPAAAGTQEPPEIEIPADKIAYIMYTSGSTGNPKGVVQIHKNVMYYTRNWVERFNITEKDRMTLFSSFCHDGSV
ncbi:MAG: AMP-binding protein, partial [bacterium]|nr:AMP-binding protein [bacterium]